MRVHLLVDPRHDAEQISRAIYDDAKDEIRTEATGHSADVVNGGGGECFLKAAGDGGALVVRDHGPPMKLADLSFEGRD